MAKELPYFKFEPNQWENGSIQICTREDKGLFMDLCSIYWSRLGDVPFKLAVQKLCNGNASAFDSLIKEGVFTVVDDKICIHFLNEQLSEFEDVSEKNRKNALEGWRKRRRKDQETRNKSDRNASELISQSENDGIREEEIREEKRRGNKKGKFSFYHSLIELGVEKEIAKEWIEVRKKKKATNSKTAFKAIANQIQKSNLTPNECIEQAVIKSWAGFQADWIDSTNSKQTGIQPSPQKTIKAFDKSKMI